MIDFRPLLSLLLLVGCAPTGADNLTSNASNSIGAGTVPEPRIHLAATYDGDLLPDHVTIAIRNDEAFPVCFSSNDLLPGSETTMVRDPGGQTISASANEALDEFRGINLAGPIVVLPPRRIHSELMNLEEYHPRQTSIILQIGFGAFRCSELFDAGTNEVRRTTYQKVIEITGGRITEHPQIR